jgi:branched-chain amino acid transport system ATP-binding protein
MEEKLGQAITHINKQAGITIVVAEQYARPVLPLIDYGYVMENGAPVLEGTSTELINNPDVKAAYFGM